MISSNGRVLSLKTGMLRKGPIYQPMNTGSKAQFMREKLYQVTMCAIDRLRTLTLKSCHRLVLSRQMGVVFTRVQL